MFNIENTIVLIIMFLAVLVLSLYKERQKRPLGNPSLVPWLKIMMATALGLMLLIAHLLRLLITQEQ
ncbi:MAG: hypothetical protein ACOYK8_02815 [Alphaproteobacteria bacterium]